MYNGEIFVDGEKLVNNECFTCKCENNKPKCNMKPFCKSNNAHLFIHLSNPHEACSQYI